MPHGTARRSRSSSPRSWNLTPQIELEISGFEMGEIDVLLDGRGLDQEDELPPIDAGATPVTRAGRPLGSWRASPALRRRAAARELRPCAGDRQGGHDVRRPALQRADRGPRLGLGGGQTRRFCHGVGRALLGGVPIISEDLAWPCGEPVDQRRHSFRLHGLATPAGDHCRRRRSLQRAHEPVRVEQEQCRDGLALSLKARAHLRVQGGQRARTSTMSRSGGMAGTGPMSGTMSARTH